MGGFASWLRRRKRHAQPTLIDPDLFTSDLFRFGITQQMLQQIALGGTMIVLPIFLQMVLEYDAMQAGLSLAPLSLTMFAVALLAGKKAGDRRPAHIIRAGFALLAVGLVALVPIVPRAESGWSLVIPLIVAGAGLGLLVSQLNNYTLSPISEERVSEAAGVNSAAGSFGLSFGLAFAGAIMLATLSFAFTTMAQDSAVLPPAEQQRVADVLETRRRGDDQHRSRAPPVRATTRDPGRDHPHQHRRPAARPADRPDRPHPRRPPRPAHHHPHRPPPRPRPDHPTEGAAFG